MEKWQSFFLNYLDYLDFQVEENDDLLKVYSPTEVLKTEDAVYTFNRDKVKDGVVGFYPGSNLFYQILESTLEKGAFASTYLERKKDPKGLFTPFLYLDLKLVSSAPKSPRPHYSLLVNLLDSTISKVNLDDFLPASKGPSLKKQISYKEALQSVLNYILEDLADHKNWLAENRNKREEYITTLKKARLSASEEQNRLQEAKSRLYPHFKANIKLLGRFFIR